MTPNSLAALQEDNGKLGDCEALEAQLREKDAEIDKLKVTLEELRARIAELERLMGEEADPTLRKKMIEKVESR